MNELENPDEQHQEVLDHAETHGIQLFTVGEKIGRVAKAESHFNSKEELVLAVKKLNLSNTTVLLKASRSIKLETILKSFE